MVNGGRKTNAREKDGSERTEQPNDLETEGDRKSEPGRMFWVAEIQKGNRGH